MSYLDLALTLEKRLEGCRLYGYADSGGVPTNGYGHTGPEVRVGEPISQDVADRNLLTDTIKADCRLESVCSLAALARLKDHERAALVSFVLNVGAESQWAIWRDVNAGNLADVPAQLRRFDKAKINGQLVVIKGLDNRRDAEVAYWNTADVEVAATLARPAGPGSGVDLSPPSHATVSMVTPPTPEPAPPLAKASLLAKATTLAGGFITAIASQAQQIHGVLTPYVTSAKVFQTVDTIAIGAIVAAGIIGILIHEYQDSARTV